MSTIAMGGGSFRHICIFNIRILFLNKKKGEAGMTTIPMSGGYFGMEGYVYLSFFCFFGRRVRYTGNSILLYMACHKIYSNTYIKFYSLTLSFLCHEQGKKAEKQKLTEKPKNRTKTHKQTKKSRDIADLYISYHILFSNFTFTHPPAPISTRRLSIGSLITRIPYPHTREPNKKAKANSIIHPPKNKNDENNNAIRCSRRCDIDAIYRTVLFIRISRRGSFVLRRRRRQLRPSRRGRRSILSRRR